MKTKKELFKWIEEHLVGMEVIPAVINGGGFFKADWDTLKYIRTNSAEFNKIEILQKGEEFEDFRYFIGAKMYKEEIKFFVRLPHKNGYNEENHDIQIAIY